MAGTDVRSILLAVVASLILAVQAHAARLDELPFRSETLTDDQVLAAIDALVEGLYERKHPTSFWEPAAGRGDGSQFQVGGYTALVALAMLYAGESYQDPRLRDAIDNLMTTELHGTYAVAVRTQLWALLPPRFRRQLQSDAQWLKDGFSPGVGGWAYTHLPHTTRRDNSLRQYGALGLWEAAKRGVHVPGDYWLAMEKAFLDMQLADGGWNYTGSGPATGSMTAAGLATLLIIQDFLRADEAIPLNRRRQSRSQEAIDNAIRWMDEHFSATDNPGRDQYFYYYLYGVERVGLAGGFKYFGGKDWYREGAAELLRRLCLWDEDRGRMVLHENERGTGSRIRNDDLAFALMFLSRGRMPSIINKLQDRESAWNNRPRDVPNLATWIAGETARHVIWQITDIDAPAEEWLDAPLMYVASHEPVTWLDHRDGRLSRVKEYLDRGGLLFAVNEGSGRAFAQSIEAVGSEMYAHYQWRTLPADHWAYTVHQPVRANQPRLRGLSNGVRELIILATEGDMPATFQVRNVQNRAHYHTASNIYFYASEMDRPRQRLASLARAVSRSVEPNSQPVQARIVRATYEGNWNPEPYALDSFKHWMNAAGEMVLTLGAHPLAEIHRLEPAPDLVMVSGVAACTFTITERSAIAQYLDHGGVILFETAGGMGDLAQSAEAMMKELMQRHAAPMMHNRIITGDGLQRAEPLHRLQYRPFSLEVLGSLDTTPRLRGIVVDGQPRVLFSRDDLSHALLGQPCWGINGYATDSARRLLRNILLHAVDVRSMQIESD